MYVCWGVFRSYKKIAHLHIEYGRQTAEICLKKHIFQPAVTNCSGKPPIFDYAYLLRSPKKLVKFG